mmetsp:Transcript_66425/g.130970  ORF Transcript_66425/g.130970 Transcript_66425/m.130970 type:complete len:252 (+) Transcript_66425:290-1045(+)
MPGCATLSSHCLGDNSGPLASSKMVWAVLPTSSSGIHTSARHAEAPMSSPGLSCCAHSETVVMTRCMSRPSVLSFRACCRKSDIIWVLSTGASLSARQSNACSHSCGPMVPEPSVSMVLNKSSTAGSVILSRYSKGTSKRPLQISSTVISPSSSASICSNIVLTLGLSFVKSARFCARENSLSSSTDRIALCSSVANTRFIIAIETITMIGKKYRHNHGWTSRIGSYTLEMESIVTKETSVNIALTTPLKR